MEKNEIFEIVVSQQIGGYKFNNPLLLKQAFTRKSFTEENGGENNEVLEFIGDKVLDIAVVRYLATKYGNDLHVLDKIPAHFHARKEPEEFKCQKNEGELTKLKQKMVEKKALAKRIDELGIAEFLIMGKGDKQQNREQEDSVKEDLFEAILGAVALDSNWNFAEIQDVAEIMLAPDSFLDNFDEADYVGAIYEWAEKKHKDIPLFKYPNHGFSVAMWQREPNVIYQNPQGGNLNHLKYTCKLKLPNGLEFEAYGTSKHEARKAVCELAFQYLKQNELFLSIKGEIENPNLEDAINQLEILSRRGYFELPTYTFEESHDKEGNPIWHVACHINGYDNSFDAEGNSKKVVKKEAAFKMLRFLLEK